jgi:hypothetical protein
MGEMMESSLPGAVNTQEEKSLRAFVILSAAKNLASVQDLRCAQKDEAR